MSHALGSLPNLKSSMEIYTRSTGKILKTTFQPYCFHYYSQQIQPRQQDCCAVSSIFDIATQSSNPFL